MIQLIGIILATCSLLIVGEAPPGAGLFHASRRAASDLEIGGAIVGVPAGASRYVSYDDLLKLPQVSYTVSDDTNFPETTEISGVALDRLASSLGAAPGSNLVVAICDDKYRTNYPPSYIAAHHPVLVLKVNGQSPANWPKAHDGQSLGPYLISHPKFTPSFQVLSHTDEPQIPFAVHRIEFRDQREVLGAIEPRGAFAKDSTVWKGYRIAQQNCYRCHNMGAEGGQMAGRPWQVLAAWAAAGPEHFSNYVRHPQAVNAAARMPGNPQYDDATIEALRAYFSTFAARMP